MEECGSVAWIDEPEPDAKQGSFSQVGGENLEEGCGVEEGAWSSVLVENDNALKSPGTSTIEVRTKINGRASEYVMCVN